MTEGFCDIRRQRSYILPNPRFDSKQLIWACRIIDKKGTREAYVCFVAAAESVYENNFIEVVGHAIKVDSGAERNVLILRRFAIIIPCPAYLLPLINLLEGIPE